MPVPTDTDRLASLLRSAYIAAYALSREEDPRGWAEVLAHGKGGAWKAIAVELIKRGVVPPPQE